MRGEPVAGDMFAGYRVVEELGSGAHGRVFRAERDGIEVALKVHLPTSDPDGRALVLRFQREAQLLQTLSSAHVVGVLEHGEEDGLLYMAQELVRGENLREILKTGLLDTTQALDIARKLLSALSFVHGAGVVHRDIKPSNIVVSRTGSRIDDVKLIDFGIAKPDRTEFRRGITSTAAVIGTAAYMPPEQMFGEGVTERSDLFSLGLVLLECVRGGTARDVWQRRVLLHQLANEPPPQVPDDLPADLGRLIARLSAPFPQHRYPSADAATADLGATTTPISPPALPPPPSTLPEFSRLGRPKLWMVAVVFGGIIIGVLVGRGLSPGPEEPIGTGAVTGPGIALVAAPPSPPPPGSALADDLPTHDVGSADLLSHVPIPPPDPDLSAGCGRRPPPLEHGNVLRDKDDGSRMQVRVPRDYDPTRGYPAMILLHRIGRPPFQLLRASGLDRVVETRDVIVLLPRSRRVLANWKRSDKDQVVSGLRWAMDQVCVDTGELYVLGEGVGGLVAEQLPCEFPGIRAMAMYDYRSTGHLLCERPVPYLHFTALKNARIPVGGGGSTFPDSLIAHERRWKELNACPATPSRQEHAHDTHCNVWVGCEHQLESCYLDSGGDWPNAGTDTYAVQGFATSTDPPTYDIGAHIWRFFTSVPDAKLPALDAPATPSGR